MPGFYQYFPRKNVIDQAVIKVNQLVGQDDGQYELFFEIAERRDGEITLTVDDDKMHAQMTVSAAWGGEEVTLPAVLKALKAANISMGLSKLKIQALLSQIPQLDPGQSCTETIANGKAAVNGTNAELTRKVSLARERLLQPQQREDGTVDMRNLGDIIMVKPNDVLMVKTPATPGSPGYDVHGTKLAPQPGKDVK